MALPQLKRTLLLTGVDPSDGQSCHLAFAPFAVFALHCFTAHALLHAPLEDDLFEEVFEACLLQMHQRVFQRVDHVQVRPLKLP